MSAYAADKKWSQLDSCRYLENKNNDGDSFLVRCGKEEFYARFYFVDAPESNASKPEQVRQQYEYFGVTMDELTRAGAVAHTYVRNALLGKPFVLHTKWANAQGRAQTRRYYSLIETNGRYLHEVMIAEGLARTKGTPTTLPSGEKSKEHKAKLQLLEDNARVSRKGVWATSVESRRKSPM